MTTNTDKALAEVDRTFDWITDLARQKLAEEQVKQDPDLEAYYRSMESDPDQVAPAQQRLARCMEAISHLIEKVEAKDALMFERFDTVANITRAVLDLLEEGSVEDAKAILRRQVQAFEGRPDTQRPAGSA